MGKLREFLTGSPERKAERAAEKASRAKLEVGLKREEEQARWEGERKGRIARAKKEGYRKGASGGGLMRSFSAGLKSFEAGAKTLTGDVDFGGIGGGLAYPGMGGGSSKQRAKPRTRRHSRKRRR